MNSKVPPECKARHTQYQPTEAELCCPKCKAPCGVFYVVDTQAGADPGCEKNHPEDDWVCTKCGQGTSGRQLALMIVRKKNLKPCAACHGTGFVLGG